MIKQTFYQLPPEDCERLTASEMRAFRWLMAALNSITYGETDLKGRLECIPNGKTRYRLMLGQLRAICNDMIGTLPIKQCKQIRNTMNDMELRLVPKHTPHGSGVVLDVDDTTYLVDHAQSDVCSTCIRDGEECRSCELYQILEAITPLNEWGNSTICPFNREDWKQK